METKKETIVVKWNCDKKGCRHTNIRTIGKYHVIFEDFCTKCGLYCHEPIVIKFKEKNDRHKRC